MPESQAYCFRELTPVEYTGLVDVINRNSRDDLRASLYGFEFDSENTALAVAGSDGKLERHPQSKTELVVFSRKSEGNLAEDLTRWFQRTHKRPYAEVFDTYAPTQLPELKVTGKDVLSYAFNQSDLVYPDRTLNTQIIAGNPEVLTEAKRQVFIEISEDTPQGRRIRRKMNEDQLRQYRRSLVTGMVHGHLCFTEESPLQLYNEDPNNYSTGFKVPALRSVQRVLDIRLARALNLGLITIDKALTMPSNTHARIEWFSRVEQKPLSSDIYNAYGWFLQKYHCAQESYKEAREGVAIAYDKKTFNRYRDVVLEFTDKFRQPN